MRCFVIKPGDSITLNPVNPEAERPTHLIPVEIVLGNVYKKSCYFAVELIDSRYYITAVPKSFHDESDPLADRRHPETDLT